MSEDLKERLLPCPFCGGMMEEVTDEDGHYFVHPGHKGLECADCWLADAWVSDESNGEGSIGEWNTRVAVARIGDLERDTKTLGEAVIELTQALADEAEMRRAFKSALQDGIENMSPTERILWRNRVIKMLAEGK
jgi:hypothetical protein